VPLTHHNYRVAGLSPGAVGVYAAICQNSCVAFARLGTAFLPIWVALAAAPAIHARQTDTAAAPSFEVASVKANQSNEPAAFEITPQRLTFRNYQIGRVIMRAYNASERQFSAPAATPLLAILTGKYDIDAKAPHPASRAEMMAMLRSLLADRFKLALRRETKEVSGYALVVDKAGPNLRDHSGDGPECTSQIAVKGEFREFRFQNCTVDLLTADLLTGVSGSIVADHTGLKGHYDFEFLASWELPGNPREDRPEPRVVNPGAPSIFAALKEQLGLRLVAGKITVEMLTIDHVEKPSAN
jgi:uncharacterized protein (TIGR03435 family)